MPRHTCSLCKKWDIYPSRIAFLHKCQACLRPFCKACAATYFLCKNCAATIPAGVQDSLVAAMSKPRKTMEATMVGTGIGAILIPTTLLVVFILVSTGAWYLFFLPILQAVSGIVMLIVNAVMRYTSRMAMRDAASAVLRDYRKGFAFQPAPYNPSPGWQARHYPSQYPDVQPIVPPATSPAIPRSAFVPEVLDVPLVPPQFPDPLASPIPRSPTPISTSTPARTPGSTSKKGTLETRGYVDAAMISTTTPGPRDKIAEFCSSCGNDLPTISDLKFCPSCGASIE